VGNELPGGQRQAAGAQDGNATPRDQSRKTEELVNYEISKTTKTEIIEGGRVNRISVAVLVDGTYVKNDKGDIVYQPRGKEEIDQIAGLVRTAIGFDQKRGDQVEVVNLRFAEMPSNPIVEPTGWLSAFQLTKDDIMRAIEMMVMGLLGVVVLLMVVRPLVRRVLAPEERALPALPSGLIAAAGPGAGADSAVAGNTELAKAEPSPTAKMIDIAQIQGRVHARSVQKVGELADKNPREAISILRQWMNEQHAA
jgi:flagellar M-ring protein FliF